MSAVVLASVVDPDGDRIALVRHENGVLGLIAGPDGGEVEVAVVVTDFDELANFGNSIAMVATLAMGDYQ